MRFDGLLGCFINCGITWIIHFTVTPSNSLRTSVCDINKRGVRPFGTSSILSPPPWFSDRCYCILNVEQTGKQSKIIKHQSGYNLIPVIVLSLLWYQDSVVPVGRFPVLCHPHLLSPKAPDEPLSFSPTTQIDGSLKILSNHCNLSQSLVALPNLIFLYSSDTLASLH